MEQTIFVHLICLVVSTTIKMNEKIIEITLSLQNRCLAAFIPAYRNERSWHEHIISGLVGGTLGGYLLSDPVVLGFEAKKQTGRLPNNVKSILIGAAGGLAIGAAIATWTLSSRGIRSNYDVRYWDNYWKKQREVSFQSNFNRLS